MAQTKQEHAILVKILGFSGINAARYKSNQEYWLAKTVFIFSLVGIVLSLCYGCVYWYINIKGAAIALLSLALVLAATFPLHRFGRSRLCAKINFAATNTALAGVVLHMGGIDSSVSCWLLGAIPGLAALLFRSARDIIYLTAFTFCLYSLVFFLELSGYPVYQLPFPKGSLVERSYTYFNFSISSFFSAMALSVFAITQSRLYKELEHQSRDAKAILIHIHQGIFTIHSPELRINADYSQYLETMLDKKNLGDRSVMEMIFLACRLSNEQIATMESILQICIGELALNFQLNQDGLVREVIYRTDRGEEKILLVDWQPIVDEKTDLIQKMLVTLRDVTEFKRIEHKMSMQQIDIDMIGEIVGVENDSFDRFMKSSQAFINENKRLIEMMNSYNPDVMKIIFINLHTIKGVARSYHLQRMTTVIHDCEQRYSAVQKGELTWDQSLARSDLERVESIFDDYDRVNRAKLRRGDNHGSIKIGLDTIRKNIVALQSIEGSRIDSAMSPLVETMKETFYSLYYRPAKLVFDEICAFLPALARDLKKAEPKVIFQGTAVGITADASEVLRNIFIHLLRNSMDHGIETVQQRLKMGKEAAGQLFFNIVVNENGFLTIHYEDDGQGLILSKLLTVASLSGIALSPKEDDLQQLANLIMLQGFSTSQTSNDISGRGMGMTAAAVHAEKIGGSIRIVVRGKPTNTGAIAFYHEIILPRSAYILYASPNQAA